MYIYYPFKPWYREFEQITPSVLATLPVRQRAALRRRGVSVTTLGKAGWKIYEDTVAYMANELSQRVAQDETLIIQCLDSNCFYVLEKTGAM